MTVSAGVQLDLDELHVVTVNLVIDDVGGAGGGENGRRVGLHGSGWVEGLMG